MTAVAVSQLSDLTTKIESQIKPISTTKDNVHSLTLSYTTEYISAYYSSDKLFFKSVTITEIIPSKGDATLTAAEE